MPTEPRVSARAILRASARLKRLGTQRVLVELEQTQPDLAEHLMESLSLIHHQLLDLGVSARQTRRLQAQIEALALICIIAISKPD